MNISLSLQVYWYWFVHIWELTGQVGLEVHPWFSSSALRVLFILLGGFERWKRSGGTAAAMWGAVSKFCSKQHAAYSRSCLQALCQSQAVEPYNCTDTATTWKKSCFISSERLDFLMVDNLSIADHAFPMRLSTSLSVDVILLLGYVKLSTDFKCLLFNAEMVPTCLKDIKSVLSELMQRPMSLASCFRSFC